MPTLSFFQKSIFYADLKILKNDRAKFKAILKKCLHTHSFYPAGISYV